MKKRLLAGLLAAMMVVSMMATTAFAAGLDEPEVHTIVVDAELIPLAQNGEAKQTKDISLALGPGASGWSEVFQVRFSYDIPTDAIIKNVRVVPGTATINAGNSQMQGTIVASQLKLTAPNGTSTTMAWSNSMVTTAFNNAPGRGTWSLQFYGTNITKPFGDWTDSIRYGSIHYRSCAVIIEYTTE